MSGFVTIKEDVISQIVEKKSKFIANLIYVESVQEAEEKIDYLKKKYYDARHNCASYRVMEGGSVVEKASDDGEPSGTAGAPMLNILKKNNMCNVLIVVTRYFGGILLGTGGLVRAYSDSLIKAIDSSIKIEKIYGVEADVIVNYNMFDNFRYYCKNNDINIVNSEYMDNIVCKIEMDEEVKARLIKDFKEKNLNINDINILGKKLIEKVYKI